MAKHECFMPRCAKKIDDEWPICTEHYQMLPEANRIELRRAYGHGVPLVEQSYGFQRVLANAWSWIVKTFNVDDRQHDPGRWERLVILVRAKDEARRQRRAGDKAISELNAVVDLLPVKS